MNAIEQICPICLKALSSAKSYFDTSCAGSKDHFYGLRTYENEIVEKRIRLDKILVSIVYQPEETTSICINKDFRLEHVVTIKQVLKLDFSDIPKLKNRLQTYMEFS